VPTYSYACKDCGYRFDKQQSFSEDSLTICPRCQGRLRKLFHSVGIIFKGSGFYHNDSRSSSHASLGPSPEAMEKRAEASANEPASAASESAKASTTASTASSSSTKSSDKTPVGAAA
jgi:putative FmdB family regulatory protein